MMVYSKELQREVVASIEHGGLSVTQAQREYGIGARQTIYNWLYRYSRTLKKGTRLVMEKDSKDERVKDLQARIKELEAALGRKSFEADVYRLMVDKAEKIYDIDIKKNFGEDVPKTSGKK